ncbi:MAG: hypothetical protein LC122_08990 [Chitinophagales bacterium]|nr:hypothetical protein [Chitinophagales bacterium]
MKQLLVIIFFFSVFISHANMASPYIPGTSSSTVYSSKDVDILKEKIFIKLNKNFESADYVIEYYINTETNGMQIPLLFHAIDYSKNFKVFVDGKEIKLLDIPAEYTSTNQSKFDKFSNSFRPPLNNGEADMAEIYWDSKNGIIYYLKDLKYFETNLSKGNHIIRVEYNASAWTDRAHWVAENSFRYSLSPAKYWKSFHELEITLDATDYQYNNTLTTTLGKPTSGKIDSIAVWHFTKLPDDFFQIVYTPQVSSLAKTMIAIEPFNIAAICFFILALLHVFAILKYRKNNLPKKYSWVVIAGSFLVPLSFFIFFIASFGFIDNLIGEAAGRYHGYTGLIIIFYPITVPIYWVITWLLDKYFKRKYSKV